MKKGKIRVKKYISLVAFFGAFLINLGQLKATKSSEFEHSRDQPSAPALIDIMSVEHKPSYRFFYQEKFNNTLYFKVVGPQKKIVVLDYIYDPTIERDPWNLYFEMFTSSRSLEKTLSDKILDVMGLKRFYASGEELYAEHMLKVATLHSNLKASFPFPLNKFIEIEQKNKTALFKNCELFGKYLLSEQDLSVKMNFSFLSQKKGQMTFSLTVRNITEEERKKGLECLESVQITPDEFVNKIIFAWMMSLIAQADEFAHKKFNIPNSLFHTYT